MKKKDQLTILESIIGCMPNNVYWLDKNCTLLGGNDNLANMFGLQSRSELVGLTYQQMSKLGNWTEGQGESFRQTEIEVMKTGIPRFNTEEPAILVAGEIRYYISSKVPLLNEKNEVIGVVGISTDITERKKMEEDLRKAKIAAEAGNKAKSEFIANMSHDIRTPLSGIIGISRMLEEKARTLKEKEYCHWVLESGEQLLGLLNGVLDVISADHIQEDDIHEENFELYESIQNLARLELPTIKMKKLDLKVEIDEAIPRYILADRTKIERILLNLLGNAIKFTEKGYIKIKIDMQTHNKKKSLCFCVSDTGIGISPDQQDKVFDRFFRVNPSYKGTYRGHGLGLNIAQRFVNLLGGELTLTSELGKGTAFSFSLPLKSGKNPHEKKVTRKLPLSKQGASSMEDINVLLVEDNTIALHLLQTYVKQTGCKITSATDGETALELVKTGHFNLMITDMGLPGISGHELTAHIRAWEKQFKRKSVPIIGLTAHADKNESDKCLSVGMNAVFTKPIDVATVENIFNQFVTVLPA